MTTVDIPMRPDPRISNTPPGWLDRPDWRDHLDTLDDTDVDWIQDEWAAAGGPWYAPDRPDPWGIWPLVLVLAVLAMVAAIVVEVQR